MVSKPLVGLTSACGKGIALVSLLPHPERAAFSLDPCEQGEAWHSYNGYVFNFEEKQLVHGNKTVREENYLSSYAWRSETVSQTPRRYFPAPWALVAGTPPSYCFLSLLLSLWLGRVLPSS